MVVNLKDGFKNKNKIQIQMQKYCNANIHKESKMYTIISTISFPQFSKHY